MKYLPIMALLLPALPALAAPNLTLELGSAPLQFSGLTREMCVGAATIERLAEVASFRPEAPVLEGMEPKGSAIDDFSGLARIIDVTSIDLPEFRADMVGLVVPFGGFEAFGGVVVETTDLEETGRTGLGGGGRWILGPKASVGSELLMMRGDRNNDFDHSSRGSEVRFLTSLQISF